MFETTEPLIPFVGKPPLKTNEYEMSENWHFETRGNGFFFQFVEMPTQRVSKTN